MITNLYFESTPFGVVSLKEDILIHIKDSAEEKLFKILGKNPFNAKVKYDFSGNGNGTLKISFDTPDEDCIEENFTCDYTDDKFMTVGFSIPVDGNTDIFVKDHTLDCSKNCYGHPVIDFTADALSFEYPCMIHVGDKKRNLSYVEYEGDHESVVVRKESNEEDSNYYQRKRRFRQGYNVCHSRKTFRGNKCIIH